MQGVWFCLAVVIVVAGYIMTRRHRARRLAQQNIRVRGGGVCVVVPCTSVTHTKAVVQSLVQLADEASTVRVVVCVNSKCPKTGSYRALQKLLDLQSALPRHILTVTDKGGTGWWGAAAAGVRAAAKAIRGRELGVPPGTRLAMAVFHDHLRPYKGWDSVVVDEFVTVCSREAPVLLVNGSPDAPTRRPQQRHGRVPGTHAVLRRLTRRGTPVFAFKYWSTTPGVALPCRFGTARVVFGAPDTVEAVFAANHGEPESVFDGDVDLRLAFRCWDSKVRLANTRHSVGYISGGARKAPAHGDRGRENTLSPRAEAFLRASGIDPGQKHAHVQRLMGIDYAWDEQFKFASPDEAKVIREHLLAMHPGSTVPM